MGYSRSMKPTPIPNFTRAESWIARGGPPSHDGFEMLAKFGFRTIVNLRELHHYGIPEEFAGQLRVVNIPVKNHSAPTIEQALQWLELCADPSARPVYVHCHHGRGRTSTFMGLVRLAQGWNVDRTLTEEIQVYEFPDEPAQVAFLRDFSERMRKGEIATPRVPNESGVTPDATTVSASGD